MRMIFVWSVAAVAVIVLLCLPFVATTQINDWIFRVAMLCIVAVSWNLMANAGQISLGHSAFWGVGAYAGVLSANVLGVSILAGTGVAICAGAVLGAVLALATGRLRGVFFAICTLALSEGLRTAALMTPDLTGGAVGLFLNQKLRPAPADLFLIGSAAAVIAVIVSIVLANTKFHYACRALRNHEGAAQMLGIDPRQYRFAVLALSGGLASGAGSINAWYGGYLDPNIAFDLFVTVQAQIAPILGGLYTVAGPVVGSFGIVFLSEFSRIWLGAHEGASQLVFGAVLVVGILFMPKGIYGSFRRLWARLFRPAEQTRPAGRSVASVLQERP
jgi:branched-chain amino acid transport system permease protein